MCSLCRRASLETDQAALQRAHKALQDQHAREKETRLSSQREFAALTQAHVQLQEEHESLQQDHAKLTREHSALQQEHAKQIQGRSALEWMGRKANLKTTFVHTFKDMAEMARNKLVDLIALEGPLQNALSPSCLVHSSARTCACMLLFHVLDPEVSTLQSQTAASRGVVYRYRLFDAFDKGKKGSLPGLECQSLDLLRIVNVGYKVRRVRFRPPLTCGFVPLMQVEVTRARFIDVMRISPFQAFTLLAFSVINLTESPVCSTKKLSRAHKRRNQKRNANEVSAALLILPRLSRCRFVPFVHHDLCCWIACRRQRVRSLLRRSQLGSCKVCPPRLSLTVSASAVCYAVSMARASGRCLCPL